MLRFKPEVRVIYFDGRLARVLELATLWSLRVDVEVHASSIDDGVTLHKPGTLHGYSLAVDLSAETTTQVGTQALAEFLRRTLGGHYDVVLEKDHVHVEWDAHRAPLATVAG